MSVCNIGSGKDFIPYLMVNDLLHTKRYYITACVMPCTQLSYSPMSDIHLVLMIPLGRRWKSYSVPSTTTVWPALFPPWKMTQTWLSYPYIVSNVHSTLFWVADQNHHYSFLFFIWKCYADPYLPFALFSNLRQVQWERVATKAPPTNQSLQYGGLFFELLWPSGSLHASV